MRVRLSSYGLDSRLIPRAVDNDDTPPFWFAIMPLANTVITNERTGAMVGFDAIDRAFRKRTITLECEHCHTDEGEIKRRACQYKQDVDAVLCYACWYNWCPVPEAD